MRPVLRLVTFDAATAGFDAGLRETLAGEPDATPGLRVLVAGRIGPGEDGERVLATVWHDAEALDAAVAAGAAAAIAAPAALHGTAAGDAITLPVEVELPPLEGVTFSIARVVRGTTRPGELEAYAAQARGGSRADRAVGEGPLALYLALDPPDRFVTLSLWGGWSHVETATGADHEHVERTRHEEMLVSWRAEHYEVVPGLALLAARAPAGEG
jgi:hypothetical protein